MRVGVLTGGGDCPGLNAVIRGIVRKGVPDYGYSFLGFRDGWRGPLEALTKPLDIPAVRGLLPRGGTILGSSRTNPFAISGGVEKIKRNLQNLGVDALIAIGGEDTLGVATKLCEMGVNVVGVPKTIDNDLSGTDYTFGFDTAVNIAMEAIDRLHTTAESHHRALIVEVMGRHAGWIALHSGMAGGANAILIPEVRFDIEQVCQWVEQRFQLDYAPIIVVAEGAKPKEGEESLLSGEKDAFGHVRLGGIGDWLAREIEARTGKEARTTVLGHVQRGGTPTARDRWLATRFGLHAIAAVHTEQWGHMVALRGTDIVTVPLAEATKELKVVDPALYAEAEVLLRLTARRARQARNRRRPRSTRDQSNTSSRMPSANRIVAIVNASTGLSTARVVTPATATSSPTLTVMLLAGSGEVLTISRRPPLTRCDARAAAPPDAARIACCSVGASCAISRPITAPTVGRIAVETASQSESK